MSQGELPAEDVLLAETVEPIIPAEPRPWGLWATLGFSTTVIVAFIAIETAIAIAFVVVCEAMHRSTDGLETNGLLFTLATWAAMPVCTALTVLLVKLRRQLSIRDYLSLNPVSLRCFLGWAGILMVFVAVTDGAQWLFRHDAVPSFMVDAYRTAVVVPLLLAALIIAAPVFEEVLFRGFMFHGIQQSRLGDIGAILITSLVWSAIHLQYDVSHVAIIFGAGILFGIARASSNSLYLLIGLHALMNVIATIELWICLWWQT